MLQGLPDTVTFAEVAPIIRANCMPCHREGQAGPFALVSYRDIRRKAKTIRKMVIHRWMPPWPADTAYSTFLGTRALNARQIATIVKWVDQGGLVGDTVHLPPMPVFPEGALMGMSAGTGKPDAVVWLPDTFDIAIADLDEAGMAATQAAVRSQGRRCEVERAEVGDHQLLHIDHIRDEEEIDEEENDKRNIDGPVRRRWARSSRATCKASTT